MNNKNLTGALGEAKAIAYMIENGYSIFTQFSGHEPFDFVAYKTNNSPLLLRVSVKSTSIKTPNAYVVTIKQNNIPFDASSCDLLLVYLVELDEIREFLPSRLNGQNTFSIPFNSERFRNRNRLKT